MDKFKLNILIIALMMNVAAMAQTTVKGTLLDSLSRAPETGAVVQFLKTGQESPVAYSVTDSTGRFERTVSGQGDYILLLQNMGRKTVSRGFKLEGQSELDFGEILVQDDAEALEGASVRAMKTLVKLDVNKLTYKVEADPDSKTGTVLDMLRKVPMVTVDGQDNITVNGSSNFKVYVDGKPNQMLSSNPSQILKVMPASSVKDIEVITNPGAKYDAEGAGGVLNLVTGMAAGASNAVSDGVYGSVNLGVTTKGENGSLFLSAKKGKFTVGINSAVGEQKLGGITYSSKQENLSGGPTMSTESELKQRSPFAFADINASYELTSRDLVSGSFGLTGFYQTATGMSTITVGDGGAAGFSYSNGSDTKYRTRSMNGSLDYQHTSEAVPGRALTVSYRYSGSPLDVESINTFSGMPGYGGFLQDDRKSVGDDNSNENTFQLDYTTPIGQGHSLSSGLKYISRHNSADDKLYLQDAGAWAYNREGSMLYDHFNSIGAAYSEYTGTFGKVTAVAGLRYEYTWQRVEYGEDYGHDFNTSFGDLVPNASLQYNISAMQNIGITYNRRIQRPGITYLNPYVDRSSSTSISYGNSDLTSVKVDNLSLVYNFYNPKWVVSLTGRYSHSGSGISSYSFFRDDILNTTYGNIVTENNTGLTAFVNWTAGPKTRVYTNSSFGYSHFASDELDQTNAGWNWNVMLGLQQTLPADILLSANIIEGGRTWNLQGWSGGFGMAVFGLSKGFFADKLKVNAQVMSNLNKGGMKIESFSQGKDYRLENVVEVPIRQVGIGLTYTFGKQGFQVKKTRKSITNDDVINNTNGQAPGTGAGQINM